MAVTEIGEHGIHNTRAGIVLMRMVSARMLTDLPCDLLNISKPRQHFQKRSANRSFQTKFEAHNAQLEMLTVAMDTSIDAAES
jgi:hypothetical protein